MQSRTLSLVIAVTLAAQACFCCSWLGGPEPPHQISPSQEAVDALSERLDNVDMQEGADGFVVFSIYFTDEEATSLLANMLADQAQEAPIADPQVHFTNGRIEVYLTVTALGELFPIPAMVALSPASTAGGVTLTLEELNLGPLPIPDDAVAGLGDMLKDAIGDALAGQTEGATITDIEVAEGHLTFHFRADPDDL